MYSMGQVVIVKYVGFGWWPAKVQYFTKEIKNAPECIVELYKHAGIFKGPCSPKKHCALR